MMMKAIIIDKACSAEDLKVTEAPVPGINKGKVLVRIKSFGINRSEIILRSKEADAPYINLPVIPGIECAGVVEDPSDTNFKKGQTVIALMGGMGRSYNGSYAEYALIPKTNVFSVNSDLGWEDLGAVPETYFTSYGSLFEELRLISGDVILVRGATSALGLVSIQLAKTVDAVVVATTRDRSKTNILEQMGAEHVLYDDGTIREQLLKLYPLGVSKVLELIGASTLIESMKMASRNGIVCVTGNLGGQYTLDGFDPIKCIPNGVSLSSFYSNYPTQEVIDRIFEMIRQHALQPPVSRVFKLENISEAHALMEKNSANGKIVVII